MLLTLTKIKKILVEQLSLITSKAILENDHQVKINNYKNVVVNLVIIVRYLRNVT